MRLTTLDRCRATGPTPDLGATWTVVIAESSPPDIIINLGCSVFGCASSPARSIKPDEIRRVAKTFTDDQARSVFLMLVLTGLRAGELHRLRWRDVSLVERVLRVVDSKSESGIRSIAIPSSLAEELNGHYQRTAFKGDGELVFCHPKRGTAYSKGLWGPHFTAALKAAGITDKVRPHHDLRPTAITLDAASGASEIAVMTKAGHSSFATTPTYLYLAGTVFREQAERIERMALGASSSEPSTDMSEPERMSLDVTPAVQAEGTPA